MTTDEEWIRVKESKWIHKDGGRTILITSVLEPENGRNYIAIDDQRTDSEIIGYYPTLKKSMTAIEDYITQLD